MACSSSCRYRARSCCIVESAPIFSSEAFANRMNGKGGWCSSGMNCMPERYQAAMKKQGKKPKQ
jgi:hypothetical protein